MRPNYAKLVKLYEGRPLAEAESLVREALGYDMAGRRVRERQYRPEDFDLGALFCETFGWNEFYACRQHGRLVSQVLEAAGATSSASFASITGQWTYSAVMDAYQAEEYVFKRLIPEKQSQFIDQEKIAGISQLGDMALVVPEAQDFPLAGPGQTWISWPEAQKRGLRVALTREMIFRDRTNVLLERCGAVGEWMGTSREKRAIDAVIDEGPGATSLPTGHRYRWRDQTLPTYGDNSGTHSWDNLAATNALTDWTSVDTAEQLLNQMVDPDTGEPIMADYNSLIVTKQLEKTALRVLNATEVRVTIPGFATSQSPMQTAVANPYAGKFQVISTRLLRARMSLATSWYFGNIARAIIYKQIFPLQVIEAPANSLDEFKTDIVRQWRADEMGAYGVVEPRYLCKSTVA